MKNLILCTGRHEIPAADGTIFVNEDLPQRFCSGESLEGLAKKGLEPFLEETEIGIYVTGYTPALIAALKVCSQHRIGVTLYHYDIETGTYIAQQVSAYMPCLYCEKRIPITSRVCDQCGAT